MGWSGRHSASYIPHLSRSFAKDGDTHPVEVWFRLEEIAWLEYANRVTQVKEPDTADSFGSVPERLDDKLYRAYKECSDKNLRRKSRRADSNPKKVLVQLLYPEIKWMEYASKAALYDDPGAVDFYPGATEALDERLYQARRESEVGGTKKHHSKKGSYV